MEGIIAGEDGRNRCKWCVGDPLYERYHDEEWGRPVDHDIRLFEKICLEGFQAGLSWITILRKRESFREAFAGFDFEQVAGFNTKKVEELMQDAAIVRNRAKIEATINNARRCIEVIEEQGSLSAYVWAYEPNPATRPAALDWDTLVTMTTSSEAKAMSKDLKKRGWSFVGPKTIYAFMQAMGLVNDHLTGCDFRDLAEADRSRFSRPETLM